MRAREAYSDEYNAIRTARKHGNLHNLLREKLMDREVRITTEPFRAKYVYLTKEDEYEGEPTGKNSIGMVFEEGSAGAEQLDKAVEEVSNGGKSPIKYTSDGVFAKAHTKIEYTVGCYGATDERIDPDDIEDIKWDTEPDDADFEEIEERIIDQAFSMLWKKVHSST